MTALEYIQKQKRSHECALKTAQNRSKGNHASEIENLQEKIRICDEIIEALQPPMLCRDCAHFKNESRTPRGAIYGECDCGPQYKNPKYGSVRACRKYEPKEEAQ